MWATNSDGSQFGLVEFSTKAAIRSSLTDAATATRNIDRQSLAGGFTSTRAALNDCDDVLKSAPPGFPRIMVLITDGNLTSVLNKSSSF